MTAQCSPWSVVLALNGNAYANEKTAIEDVSPSSPVGISKTNMRGMRLAVLGGNLLLHAVGGRKSALQAVS